MSIVEAHKWLDRDLSARQKRIKAFCASGDAEQAHELLSLVKAPYGYGIYASIGPNYQHAIFGRDSIEVAEDLLLTNQHLAKEVILLLAHLQGYEFNMSSEEEVGKIHHEYRSLHFNNHEVPIAARKVLARLGPQWGGTEKLMLYYGSVDATPLFIRLVHRYFKRYDDDLLDHRVATVNGRSRHLREHVRAATEWLVAKITASPWQLLEYKRMNLVGLFNQSWEDSSISYLHTDGAVANGDGGIAAIEVQGYAYDALRGAAEMVALNEAEADSWRHLASIVRDTTLQRLWMPSQHYFAMGLDRSNDGETRQIATLTSNPALLLESTIFDFMPSQLSWPYIEGIVRMLFSDEFLTPAGFRLRAKRHTNLVSFADYHGSEVTWPKQTYDIAKGLRKYGFYTLASYGESMILQTVMKAGEFYEFFFVDTDGKVKYHYRQENPDEPSFHDLGAANVPDAGQAWTISAVLAIVNHMHNPTPVSPVIDSVRTLESSLLQQPWAEAINKRP